MWGNSNGTLNWHSRDLNLPVVTLAANEDGWKLPLSVTGREGIRSFTTLPSF